MTSEPKEVKSDVAAALFAYIQGWALWISFFPFFFFDG